jgi:hypothetical protein
VDTVDVLRIAILSIDHILTAHLLFTLIQHSHRPSSPSLIPVMSQLSSQVQDPNWVSVPVAKFSHNNSPYGTKSFIWIHINHRNDLDFVIRNARVVDDYGNFQDRILMKVTGGAEVLVRASVIVSLGYC